jgi:hypothetical protein
VGIDVDNALWQWGPPYTGERVLKPILTLESEDPPPSRIKEVFVDTMAGGVIVMAEKSGGREAES